MIYTRYYINNGLSEPNEEILGKNPLLPRIDTHSITANVGLFSLFK